MNKPEDKDGQAASTSNAEPMSAREKMETKGERDRHEDDDAAQHRVDDRERAGTSRWVVRLGAR